jgi:hypothetical protein
MDSSRLSRLARALAPCFSLPREGGGAPGRWLPGDKAPRPLGLFWAGAAPLFLGAVLWLWSVHAARSGAFNPLGFLRPGLAVALASALCGLLAGSALVALPEAIVFGRAGGVRRVAGLWGIGARDWLRAWLFAGSAVALGPLALAHELWAIFFHHHGPVPRTRVARGARWISQRLFGSLSDRVDQWAAEWSAIRLGYLSRLGPSGEWLAWSRAFCLMRSAAPFAWILGEHEDPKRMLEWILSDRHNLFWAPAGWAPKTQGELFLVEMAREHLDFRDFTGEKTREALERVVELLPARAEATALRAASAAGQAAALASQPADAAPGAGRQARRL